MIFRIIIFDVNDYWFQACISHDSIDLINSPIFLNIKKTEAIRSYEQLVPNFFPKDCGLLVESFDRYIHEEKRFKIYYTELKFMSFRIEISESDAIMMKLSESNPQLLQLLEAFYEL